MWQEEVHFEGVGLLRQLVSRHSARRPHEALYCHRLSERKRHGVQAHQLLSKLLRLSFHVVSLKF